ncbi:uncharacterized protein LOC108828041 isoform X2 [Raphanus sativus]|uniref:Uncharacterized protein LOC108828041 isoform X2 n=1 Tax=Raphanus sativus TaxID=3726 RepID=A0A6J0LB48_RAPSA|nr:uncharacterized protein LOC108828041 isoform X2 [Raphanus sativus]
MGMFQNLVLLLLSCLSLDTRVHIIVLAIEKEMSDESGKASKEDEEEYVLIDLDDVSRHIDIPSDAPYTLSGLDTLNPILTIDGKIKLVGEYLETIGTCLAFSDKDPAADNLTPHKTVEPVAKLHKILMFRLALDNDDGATTL